MEESKAKRDLASWEAEQAEQESWLESFDAGRGNESVGAESPGEVLCGAGSEWKRARFLFARDNPD